MFPCGLMLELIFRNETYLVEEYLGLSEDVFKLCQLEVVPFEGLGVLVHFAEFIFQFLKRGLEEIKRAD